MWAATVAWSLLAVNAAGVAQTPTAVVVPSTFEHVEAPNAAFWAVSPFAARRQLLLDERHLPGLRGKQIQSIWVRRNSGDASPLAGGAVQIEVALSHARTAADQPADSFAANRGPNPQVVYAGVLALPASPAQRNAPAGWQVEVRLQKPYTYNGGTLCIETVTQPVNSRTSREPPWWPIDALVAPGGGAVTSFGQSCIPGMGPQPAGVEAANFSSGATATFFLRGKTAETRAICFLGTSDRTWGALRLPLDLTAVGAAGCAVYTDLLAPIQVPLRPLPNSAISHGAWSVRIPAAPVLVGIPVFSQWVVPTGSNGFGLALSNGVRAVVGARSTLTGVSWVENPDPKQDHGAVYLGRVPILRFEALAP